MNIPSIPRRLLTAVVTVSLYGLCGCTTVWQELVTGSPSRGDGASSSIVDFLYPDGGVPPGLADTVPQLALPLRVGLAFVPSAANVRPTGLTEERKQHLLESVKNRWRVRVRARSWPA